MLYLASLPPPPFSIHIRRARLCRQRPIRLGPKVVQKVVLYRLESLFRTLSCNARLIPIAVDRRTPGVVFSYGAVVCRTSNTRPVDHSTWGRRCRIPQNLNSPPPRLLPTSLPSHFTFRYVATPSRGTYPLRFTLPDLHSILTLISTLKCHRCHCLCSIPAANRCSSHCNRSHSIRPTIPLYHVQFTSAIDDLLQYVHGSYEILHSALPIYMHQISLTVLLLFRHQKLPDERFGGNNYSVAIHIHLSRDRYGQILSPV